MPETDAKNAALPSKSQRKRDMLALQKLGERLTRLSPATLAGMNLPDGLREAVEEARKIHQHGALKRQLQYIGRIMRNVDADGIRSRLETLESADHKEVERHHRLEQLRQQLIDGGDRAIDDLLEENPAIDRKSLRQLVGAARGEHQQGKNGKSFRALFRFLRDLEDRRGKPIC